MDTLPDILSGIWSKLAAAADKAERPWGVAVLSSVGTAGGVGRTVVLRQVDEKQSALLAFTDRRSRKVEELQQQPHACWTFYDPVERQQLVARTSIEILTEGALVDSCWRSSRPESLHCYLNECAPGTVLAEKPRPIANSLQLTELAGGRQNFVVLRALVLEFDWLQLSRTGNIRARFSWHGDAVPQSAWLMP